MMRVVIVDDEELARRGIRARLLRASDVDIVAECCNASEAVASIRHTSPDLVFLDVQMPGKTGFDVIESIGWGRFPQVIFVTAHDNYAIRAFEVNALDYLLKPIDDERFELAFQRARKSLTLVRDGEFGRRLSSVLGDFKPSSCEPHGSATADRLVVRSGGKVVFVKISEIDWIEAADDYVTLHARKQSWLLRQTISEMETNLAPNGFARIHRSTMVNLERIVEMKALDNGEYHIFLRDGTQLKLSRNYRHALSRMFDGCV
jgi:two-component system LytT family response regulator